MFDEVLRSACAKQLVDQHQVVLRSKALRVHQWASACWARVKPLCHWRGTIERMVAKGSFEPLVVADLDLVIIFCNAEWPRMRQALRTHFQEAGTVVHCTLDPHCDLNYTTSHSPTFIHVSECSVHLHQGSN